MGLGANEDGHCSSCDSDHLRPWGTQCLGYKNALEKCADLNVETTEYKQYLDLNLVRRAKDLPIPPAGTGTVHDGVDDKNLEQIKRLTEINLKQKAQIQSLVSKMNDTTPQVQQKPDHGPLLQQIFDRFDRLERGPTGHGGARPTPVFSASTAACCPPVSQPAESPAVAAMGQMAEAMAQLSVSIDPSTAKKSGNSLRPEYQYCVIEKGMPLKTVDPAKLSISEYLYGMCLVMDHLLEMEGDWMSYFQHFKRVMKFFVGKKYVNAAYVGYDKEVVDSYLKYPAGGFSAADSLAIPTHFCSANEHETQNTRSRMGNRHSRGDGKPRQQSLNVSQPEDWPEEACFVYNSSFCNGACGKQHICGKCLI